MTIEKHDGQYKVTINGKTRSYIINIAHRRKRGQKSKWTIAEKTEVQCFETACSQFWMLEAKGWGLLLNGNIVQVLGVTKNVFPSKIAKFVDSNEDGIWHGYPADYQRNPQDRPDISILKRWMEQDIISVPTMRKIRGGQKCNL